MSEVEVGYKPPTESKDYQGYEVERVLTEEEREKAFRNLLRTSKRIDQGENGIILFTEKLDLGFSEELSEIPEELASKLIKVYDKESVGGEFKLQHCAHEVLEDNRREDREYAEIPAVHVHHDMEVTEEVKEDLDSYGFPEKEVGDRLEVMVMDYIEGQDLGTYLYRNLAKEYQDERELGDWVDNVESFDFTSLQSKLRESMNLNGFEDVSNKLKAKDFSFPDGFLGKIKNTLKLLHKSDFYHRDLHERNIMLDENNEPYIIDFGKSAITDKEHPYNENGDRKHIGDFQITKRHQQLEKSKEEEQSDKLNELRRRVERIGDKKEGWSEEEIKEKVKTLKELNTTEGQNIENYIKYSFDPPTTEVELFLLYKFVKDLPKEKKDKIVGSYPKQDIANELVKLIKDH